MKAAKELGYITGYRHAFGLQHALEALVLAPVITGVAWYEGFDEPDANGAVTISGSVRGGHEFEVVGIDVDARTVRACNSWGADWGDHGYFQFSWDTWDRLLHERGDVTTAIVAA
jgi:Papain family cysteine protease.